MSARMDHVRPRDIEIVDIGGVSWVRAETGGISTNATHAGLSGHVWRLDAGHDYGPLLVVWNDHGAHWSWEPVEDMLFVEYEAALRSANAAFRRMT